MLLLPALVLVLGGSAADDDSCAALTGVTAPPAGYRVDYAGVLNGAPYPLMLRNEVISGQGIRVRYRQGAGPDAESIDMAARVSIETVGGVILPLAIRPPRPAQPQIWSYNRDPAAAIAALAPGQGVVLQMTAPSGTGEEYSITFTGCASVEIEGTSHAVNVYMLDSGDADTGERKTVSLSSRNGWWLREDNLQTGLVMTAVRIHPGE